MSDEIRDIIEQLEERIERREHQLYCLRENYESHRGDHGYSLDTSKLVSEIDAYRGALSIVRAATERR